MLTCAMSWESFSHGFAPALSSPLRKTAPYGRPVHRLGDRAGRSPGSRVVAQLRLAFPVSQWPYGRGLAAYSCGGSHGLLRACISRVPSFVPGVTRGTSTLKCSCQPAHESSAAGLSCAGGACSSHDGCNQVGGSAGRLGLGRMFHLLHMFEVPGMFHVLHVLHVFHDSDRV